MNKTTAKTINARAAVVTAISSALDAVAKTGSLMMGIAQTTNRHYAGDEIPKADIDAIASKVGDKQGWSGKTLEARVSEVRVVLKACAKLPKYLESLSKSMDSYNWHDAMKLARRINAGDSVADAVAFVKNGKGDAGGKGGNPAGRTVGALSSLFDSVRGERRDAVRKALKVLADAGIVKVSPKVAEKIGL